MRDDLQQVVLHDVADRADLLVEACRGPADAEALGHRDLHVLDVVAVPDRLEERVREAEVEQVLHRFLAEKVVDAKDGRLREAAMQRVVQLAAPRRDRGRTASRRRRGRRRRSPTARSSSATVREQARRNRQVVQRTRRVAERRAQRGERRRLAVVAVDVAQRARRASRRPPGPGRRRSLEAVADPLAQAARALAPPRATPMTGTSSMPRRMRPCSAGKIFL